MWRFLFFNMYLALYRKWRPKLFDDVVAQKHITVTLKNEVKFNKVAHAYLFTGPRGTGKTSCARIFSKALNCLNNIDGEPCCACEICKGIENGTILDIVELDGASSNSVNDVKILIDEANFVPSYCKFKIYIIDEVHMLSASAFNALLKTMEEPPPHVVFILATTEVNKVLKTIVSRCQRFDFRRISASNIEQNLIKISKLENIELTQEAAKKIAIMSGGALRDAVSILDECFAVSSTIDLNLVNNIFGFVDEIQVLSLFEFVAGVHRIEALNIINSVCESGKDLQSFCSDFIEFCREIVMCTISENYVFDVFSEHVFSKILSFSKKFNLSLMSDVLTESLNCFESLKSALNKKLKFELFILSLCFKFENFNRMTADSLGNNLNRVDVALKGSSNFDYNSLNSNVSRANLKSKELSKVPEPTEIKLEPLKNWEDILESLKAELSDKMLSGFLAGSEAFVSGDKLYINFKNQIVSKKVLEKSAEIAKLVKQKTGTQYRIFIKKSKVKNDEETTNHEGFLKSGLSNFLGAAKNLKIDVDENE